MLNSQQDAALRRLSSGLFFGPSKRSQINILKKAEPSTLLPALTALIGLRKNKNTLTLDRLFFETLEGDWNIHWSAFDQRLRDEIVMLEHTTVLAQKPERQSPWGLMISLCHPDGYERQKGISEVRDLSAPGIIELLYIRCNDWVPPVAAAAELKLYELRKASKDLDLERYFTATAQLANAERNVCTKLTRAFYDQVLSSPKLLTESVNILSTTNRQETKWAISRFFFENLNRLSIEFWKALLQFGTHSSQLKTLQESKVFSAADRNKLLQCAKKAPWAALRRERLRILAEDYPEQSEPELVIGLTDYSASIREISRYYLKDWTKDEFRSHYLSALESDLLPRAYRAILYGLKEVDPNLAHSRAFAALYRDSTVSALKTHITCLGFSNPEINKECLVNFLSSPSLSISHATFKKLLLENEKLSHDTLLQLALDRESPEHTQDFAYQLLASSPKWEALKWHLSFLSHPDERVHRRAHHNLGIWVSRFGCSFIDPPRSIADDIQTLLKENQHRLTPSFFEHLCFLIKPYLPNLQ